MNCRPALNPTTRRGLLIEPLDTLFFRDGRPFDPADRGRSGLPIPQTLAGMVRTYLMRLAGIESRDMHGLRDKESNSGRWLAHIAVQGPWLARIPHEDSVEELYFPAPAHLVEDESKKLELLAPLSPSIHVPGWRSRSRTYDKMRPLMHLGDWQSRARPKGGYLTLAGITSVLNGEVPNLDRSNGTAEWVRPDCLFDHENRVGIGVNSDTHTTGDGQIYSASHLRLREHIGFYAEVGWEEGAPPFTFDDHLERAFPPEGVILPFGGEGRRVRVRPVDRINWPKVDDIPSPDQGGFTMLLISPVIFHPRKTAEDPDRPVWQPPDNGILAGAAIPHPLAISGWDLAGDADNHWKPRQSGRGFAVPAGAVYFWQNGRHAKPDLKPPPWHNMAEKLQERAAGWGMALRGRWTYAGH